jgi:hypothetical protein
MALGFEHQLIKRLVFESAQPARVDRVTGSRQ